MMPPPPPAAAVMPPPVQHSGLHLHNGHAQNNVGMQPAMSAPSSAMAAQQQQQQPTKDNMVIGNMSSSMNQLMDENRYLQMLQ